MPKSVIHTPFLFPADRICFRPAGEDGAPPKCADVEAGDTYTPPSVSVDVTSLNREVVLPRKRWRGFACHLLMRAKPMRLSKDSIEAMMPGDLALLNCIFNGRVGHDVDRGEVQDVATAAAQLLFEHVSMRNDIMSLPGLDQSVRTYFETGDRWQKDFFSSELGFSVRGACSAACKIITGTRAIRGFLEASDKGAFIFPALINLDEWTGYPEERRLRDITIVADDAALRDKAVAVIQSLRASGIQEDVLRKFVAGFVDIITIESSLDDDGDTWGRVRSIDIREMELVPEGIRETTIIHEAEHLRFREIVKPLLESGLLMAKATNNILTHDDLPGKLMHSFIEIMGEGRLTRRSGGVSLHAGPFVGDMALHLLDELFANLREMEAMLIGARTGAFEVEKWEMRWQVTKIRSLYKAASKLICFDPLLQGVIGAHVFAILARELMRS
jgi:hypothetical protein